MNSFRRVSSAFVLFVGITIPCIAAEQPTPPKAAPEEKSAPKQISVRLEFHPGGGPARGEAGFQGASWSKLAPGLDPKALTLQARAGIGDKFPVQENEQTTLFEITLENGTDDHLMVSIDSEAGSQKLRRARDKEAAVLVAGVKYLLLYPTLHVAGKAGERPTTNKATIVVKRLR
jgi:hypothetical protein